MTLRKKNRKKASKKQKQKKKSLKYSAESLHKDTDVAGLSLLCRGEDHSLGPWQQWTDKSKAVSLMLDEIFIFNGDWLTNEVRGTV